MWICMEVLSERCKMRICYRAERKLAAHAFKILSPYSCYILQSWRVFVGVIRWKNPHVKNIMMKKVETWKNKNIDNSKEN